MVGVGRRKDTGWGTALLCRNWGVGWVVVEVGVGLMVGVLVP